jgi:hypothetical protein
MLWALGLSRVLRLCCLNPTEVESIALDIQKPSSSTSSTSTVRPLRFIYRVLRLISMIIHCLSRLIVIEERFTPSSQRLPHCATLCNKREEPRTVLGLLIYRGDILNTTSLGMYNQMNVGLPSNLRSCKMPRPRGDERFKTDKSYDNLAGLTISYFAESPIFRWLIARS